MPEGCEVAGILPQNAPQNGCDSSRIYAGKGAQEHNNWRQIINMRYERKREEGTAAFYEVLEQGRKTAEFSYAMKTCRDGRGDRQFWIERIHMEQDYLDYSYLDAVLKFIQYKCWCGGCTAMYVRVSAVNLMDMERYQRYGFYVMTEQVTEYGQGESGCHYVLKYPLPREWEEMMNMKERTIYYEGKR